MLGDLASNKPESPFLIHQKRCCSILAEGKETGGSSSMPECPAWFWRETGADRGESLTSGRGLAIGTYHRYEHTDRTKSSRHCRGRNIHAPGLQSSGTARVQDGRGNHVTLQACFVNKGMNSVHFPVCLRRLQTQKAGQRLFRTTASEHQILPFVRLVYVRLSTYSGRVNLETCSASRREREREANKATSGASLLCLQPRKASEAAQSPLFDGGTIFSMMYVLCTSLGGP